jgi:hypothetical protein
MFHLPRVIVPVLEVFAPVFSNPTWKKMKVLLIGFILAPAGRTVSSALRVMGLSFEAHFANYHRVLNRDRWSARQFSQILLNLLVQVFVAEGEPIVIGIDETIERRRGRRIAAKGIYRDPVRSSKEFFVKTSGLRWISMMLLAPIPFANRVWALPFFTVLAPSERYHQQRRKRHKSLTAWARQMIVQLRRWIPDRSLVVVGDGTYAALELLSFCSQLKNPLTLVARLRLDAALYEPAPARIPGKSGRPRKKGKRQPNLEARLRDPQTQWHVITTPWYGGEERAIEVATGTSVWYHSGMPPAPIRWVLIRDPLAKFDPQALLCTDLLATPEQMVSWFVLRWQLEVTFHEVREHLGFETQRQWSDRAIERTSPVILALFSLVTVFAHKLDQGGWVSVRTTIWYRKENPTFADALALVRKELWPKTIFATSKRETDMIEIPSDLLNRMVDVLAYAA